MLSKSYSFLILVLALAGLSGWLYSTQDFNYGLDIRGGVRFTYQMDLTKLSAQQRENLGTVRNRVVQIMQNRASGTLGVVEPVVVPKGSDQIVIELPGFTDITKAEQVIGTSARIEFYHATNVTTNLSRFRTYTAEADTQATEPIVRFRRTAGTGELIEPGTPEYAQIIRGWDLILAGDDLASAVEQVAPQGGYQPLMIFSPSGSRKMSDWSRRFMNRQENIATVLDGRVLSIAFLRDNTILNENAVVDGSFPVEYVRNLVNLLNAGALPVDLKQLSSETVDPTIGATALSQIVFAGLISFGLISLFLLGYYSIPGVVALLALALYVVFTLSVLKLINATFSLAAIAGFILSVGMAVDANILVFERFKEEMKLGRKLETAINLGFNRALPAIIDSNACTILTSIVLANLGTGPVRGFATTLIIGVAISLFTAVFVTRSLLLFFVGSGIATNEKLFALGRNWFGEGFEARANTNPLKIVEKSRRWFAISVISVLVCTPFMFMGGLKMNVEFRGGSEAIFSLGEEQRTSAQMVRGLEEAGFRGSNVKFGELTPRNVSVLVPGSATLDQLATEQEKVTAIAAGAGLGGFQPLETRANEDGGLTVTFSSGGALTESQIEANLERTGFGDATATFQTAQQTERLAYLTIPPSETLAALPTETARIQMVAEAAGLDPARSKGFTEIGPAIQQETIRNAVLGVLLSTALIVLYLAGRFGFALGNFGAGLRFGLSAIGALVHDVLVVLGITALAGFVFGWELSALFITSMLTVIGFSVHDTIVIFDRIRENLRKPLPGEDFGRLVNRSVSQSFARSINTSMTVIASLIILIAFGTPTPDLKLFCVTMLAGIISGTYSSIFNAAPILYLWDKARVKSKGELAGFLGLAQAEIRRHSVITTRAIPIPVPDGPPLESAQPGAPIPPQNQPVAPRTYGQVKRRARQQDNRRDVEE